LGAIPGIDALYALFSGADQAAGFSPYEAPRDPRAPFLPAWVTEEQEAVRWDANQLALAGARRQKSSNEFASAARQFDDWATVPNLTSLTAIGLAPFSFGASTALLGAGAAGIAKGQGLFGLSGVPGMSGLGAPPWINFDQELLDIRYTADHDPIKAGRSLDVLERMQGLNDSDREGIKDTRSYIDSYQYSAPVVEANKAAFDARMASYVAHVAQDDVAAKQAASDDARRIALAARCPELYESPLPISVLEAACNAKPGDAGSGSVCGWLPQPLAWVCGNPGKTAAGLGALAFAWFAGPPIFAKIQQTRRAAS
jgi:hypothetical protein